MKGILEPYLTFSGFAREAALYYADVFELEQPQFMMFDDLPESEKEGMEGAKGVMHTSLNFGNAHLMISDSPFEPVTFGNAHTLSWASESEEEVDRVWQKLTDGGHILMALEPTFWSKKYGSVKDKFGVDWMIQVYSPFAQE